MPSCIYPGPDSYREYRVSYRVEVDAMGCWTADRIGTAGGDEGVEAHLTGCISALDLERDRFGREAQLRRLRSRAVCADCDL